MGGADTTDGANDGHDTTAGTSGTDGGNHRMSGLRLYLLLRVNRWVLVGAILGVVYVLLVLGSQAGLSPLREIVEANDGVEFIFSAFIGAIITGTAIVVTINQLVLSQELGAVGDQRERMQASMDFRRDVEEAVGTGASAPEPAVFVDQLVSGIGDHADRLADAATDETDPAVRSTIREYVDELTDNADTVRDQLDDAQFGTFAVIWAALGFDYSRFISEGRRLQSRHEGSLSEEAHAAIDDLVDVLTLYGPAREHFKTLYFQWTLIDLSRALLYISVPALAVMGLLLMYVDDAAVQGTTLGVDNLVFVTSAGFVVGIAPFVVFMVYILRIASVAKRTLAMGPFILRESERETGQE